MIYISYIVPIISLIGLAYIGYRYINLFIKINKLENEFSLIVNHTFRTPLTRILWLSKELEEELSLKERMTHIQNITNATERILGIVDTVAGIKKINDISLYSFKKIPIGDIIKKSIEKYQDLIKKKDMIFNIANFQDVPALLIDYKKISFVIDSLIENAIFYTPNNGKIIIGYTSNNKNITLFIKDSGIGLDFIDKLRIFSKFYRNKKAVLMNTDGMGLCLYLTKKIVKRHGGKIYIKSKGLNKGSTFYIKLPLSR